MKLLLAALLCVAICVAEEKCNCPPTVQALIEGKAIVVSKGGGGMGSIHVPPCCEQKLRWKGTAADKNTPGVGCGGITSCSGCTVLDFCVYDNDAKVCADINSIATKSLKSYSHNCGDGGTPYVAAEETEKAWLDTYIKPEPFVQKAAFDPSTVTEKPKVIFAAGNPNQPGAVIGWPKAFDGMLPAACKQGDKGCEGMAYILPHYLHDKRCPCAGHSKCDCAGGIPNVKYEDRETVIRNLPMLNINNNIPLVQG